MAKRTISLQAVATIKKLGFDFEVTKGPVVVDAGRGQQLDLVQFIETAEKGV